MTKAPAQGRERSFAVDVGRLRHQGGAVMEVERRGEIAGLEMRDSWVPPGAEVTVRAALEAAGDRVVVRAVISAPFEGSCRRCLGIASGRVEVEATEVFSTEGDGAGGSYELLYPISGEILDLAALARDAILLELPQAPLCRPDCAGICPTCGAELNEGPCGCEPAGGDPRWAALDELRHDA